MYVEKNTNALIAEVYCKTWMCLQDTVSGVGSGLNWRMTMSKYKVGDKVKWFVNEKQYVLGIVTEVCEDGSYFVEHGNGQERKYNERELARCRN